MKVIGCLVISALVGVLLVFSQPEVENNARLMPPGDLDLSFNGSGKNRIGFGRGNDQFNGVAVQTDGKIVAVGGAVDGISGSNSGYSVARFNADGSPDTSFAGDGFVDTRFESTSQDIFHAVAIQSDGKIVAVGQTFKLATASDFSVARFNPDGSPDVTFDGDGVSETSFAVSNLNDIARAVVIQSDGKIVVGGAGRLTSGNSIFALARFNIDGSLDTSFDGDGKLTTAVAAAEVRSLAVQADGKIVAAGFTGIGDVQFCLARYNSNGSLDTSFDADGIVITSFGTGADRANSVLIQPDGKIVAAGSATVPTLDFAVARYNPDGSLDTSFDTDGLVTTPIFSNSDEARALVIQIDGKLIASGSALGSITSDFAVVRYNVDGSLDTSFDTDGKVTTPVGSASDEALAAALQTDGKLVAAGFSTAPDFDSALVRYNQNGSLDTSFDSDGKVTSQIGNFDTSVDSIAIQPDGKTVVTGTLLFGTNFDFLVARFNTDGTLDNTFDNDGRVQTSIGGGNDQSAAILVQPDAKVVVAGSTKAGSFDDFAVVRYNPDGSPDTTFDGEGRAITALTAADDQPFAAALQSDGKIIVGGRAGVFFFQFALVRYNPNGSLDTTFDADGIVTTAVGANHANITDIAVQSDGKIVVAGNSSNGANNDFTIARYNSDGSLDTTFDGDGIASTPIFSGQDLVSSLAIQLDGKYVVAGFANNGAFTDFAVARYNPDGSLDTTFDGDGIVTTPIGTGNSQTSDVAIQADGKIVVGGWSTFSGNSDFVVVRYNANGSLDSSLRSDMRDEFFGVAGIARSNIMVADIGRGMKLQTDGKIVIAGTSNGLFGVSRLLNDIAPTAANVSVGGRVFDSHGNAVLRARVSVVDPTGNIRTAVTNSFGYYRFDVLPAGDNYVFSVSAKEHQFQPQVINVTEDLTALNFTALPSGKFSGK